MCSKKLKNTIGKIDPLLGGDKILDKLGLPSVLGEENGIFNQPEAILSTGSTISDPTAAPNAVDAGVLAARDDERRRRLSASGQNSTILTGSNGLGGASTGRKSLLGA